MKFRWDNDASIRSLLEITYTSVQKKNTFVGREWKNDAQQILQAVVPFQLQTHQEKNTSIAK